MQKVLCVVVGVVCSVSIATGIALAEGQGFSKYNELKTRENNWRGLANKYPDQAPMFNAKADKIAARADAVNPANIGVAKYNGNIDRAVELNAMADQVEATNPEKAQLLRNRADGRTLKADTVKTNAYQEVDDRIANIDVRVADLKDLAENAERPAEARNYLNRAQYQENRKDWLQTTTPDRFGDRN